MIYHVSSMITKRDLDTMAKNLKRDLREEFKKEFVTKKEFNTTTSDIVELMHIFRNEAKEDFNELKELLISFRTEVASILKNHEGRIRSLEDNTFS